MKPDRVDRSAGMTPVRSDRIERGEHGDIRAKTQGKRQDRHCRKRFFLAERAGG
jgi:hypothetical protein